MTHIVIKHCHIPITFCLLAQSWTGISRVIRLNKTHYPAYKTGDKTQLKQIYDMFANMIDYDKSKTFINIAFKFNHKVQRVNNELTIPQNKRAMMNTDIDAIPNGRLHVAKAPTNSVSMTQLYNQKQLTGAVPMHSEPTLATMYYTYMIQQPSKA